jgi:hypothetical protein
MCRHVSSEEPSTVVLFPRRQMLLRRCRQCRTVWLRGPYGESTFSPEEFHAVKGLRRRYVTGELRT